MNHQSEDSAPEDSAECGAERARARTLRREGMSRCQIAHARSEREGRARQWTADLARPEWTRRPNAKEEQREHARRLRRAGWTYPEIATEVGVSKSSVSLWVRDLPAPSARSQRRRDAAQARWAPVVRETDIRRQQTKLTAAREIDDLTDRELLVAGAALYWAEGQKDKSYSRRENVQFINSDPDVIALFVRWLRLLGVDLGMCRLAVSIHETADVSGAEHFWAKHLGVDVADLGKTTVKRHQPKTVRANCADGYHGCLVIQVRGSAELYRRVEGWWYGIVYGATSLEAGIQT